MKSLIGAALGVLVAVALTLALALPTVSQAKRSCGRFMDVTIVTHGGLSCKKAKEVYKTWQTGKGGPPKGWDCGLSARGCHKGKQGFTFH